MNEVRYKVRALENGIVVYKDEFRRLPLALEAVERKIAQGQAVRIRKVVEQVGLTIVPNLEWGIRPHDPWGVYSGVISTIFIHTSVTTQLSPLALPRQERAQMRSVDNIAYGRGYNGFSYNFGVFPSGRAYEGRGFRVVEAATEDYNTITDSICTIGNTDAFEPTEAQIEAIVGIIKKGQRLGYYAKTLDIRGHREVAPKACPGILFTNTLLNEIQKRVN